MRGVKNFSMKKRWNFGNRRSWIRVVLHIYKSWSKRQSANMFFALIEFAAGLIRKFHFFQCVEMFLPLSGKVFVQMYVKLKSNAHPLWSEGCNDERHASTFGHKIFVQDFIFVKIWSKAFNKCWPLVLDYGWFEKNWPKESLIPCRGA